MKLTGKTKEAFLKWLDTDRRMELHLPDVYLNALIIEFFDSVGIYTSIHYETFGNHFFNVMITNNHITTNLRTNAPTRTEATNAAIEKANEIYNSVK